MVNNRKLTLEQRIARLERMLKNEARYQNKDGDKLVNAIFNDDNDKAIMLIRSGVDPNSKNRHGMTALFAAVNCNNYKVAKELLEAGADPNKSIKSVGVDWYGDGEDIEEEETPLSAAEFDDNNQMVALLKRYGAR